jgi:hypothetical protein
MLVRSVAAAEPYLPVPVGLCLPVNAPSTVSSFRFRFCNYEILLVLISIEEVTSLFHFFLLNADRKSGILFIVGVEDPENRSKGGDKSFLSQNRKVCHFTEKS